MAIRAQAWWCSRSVWTTLLHSSLSLKWKDMMGHSADNELPAWSHTKSCGQQLGAQVETREDWCPSGASSEESMI